MTLVGVRQIMVSSGETHFPLGGIGYTRTLSGLSGSYSLVCRRYSQYIWASFAGVQALPHFNLPRPR